MGNRCMSGMRDRLAQIWYLRLGRSRLHCWAESLPSMRDLRGCEVVRHVLLAQRYDWCETCHKEHLQ